MEVELATAVRVDLLISLDGFATTTDITPEMPFGNDWGRLTTSYVATRTFRERVFHDNSGAGTTGVNDAYARAYFENIGAEIMGAGKFGLHNFPNDPNWKGWWGDEPPFHCPVFVLTHRERPYAYCFRHHLPLHRHRYRGRPRTRRSGCGRQGCPHRRRPNRGARLS